MYEYINIEEQEGIHSPPGQGHPLVSLWPPKLHLHTLHKGGVKCLAWSLCWRHICYDRMFRDSRLFYHSHSPTYFIIYNRNSCSNQALNVKQTWNRRLSAAWWTTKDSPGLYQVSVDNCKTLLLLQIFNCSTEAHLLCILALLTRSALFPVITVVVTTSQGLQSLKKCKRAVSSGRPIWLIGGALVKYVATPEAVGIGCKHLA